MTIELPEIDPARSALLAMDYQAAILASFPGGPQPLLTRVADAIAIARRQKMHVAYVRVAFDDADLQAMPLRNKMASRVKSAGLNLHNDAPGTAICGEVAPQPGDIIVRKTRVGAFSTTDLDRQLRERAITTLLLAGVSTSGVVLSTVRDAADRDYQIVVLSDACADPQPEVHAFLIEHVFPRQADVMTTADLRQRWP